MASMISPSNKGRSVGVVMSISGGPSLFDYFNGFEYVDPASGSSDALTVELADDDLDWLKKYYPTLGTAIEASISLTNWNDSGDNKVLRVGTFTLDDAEFSGNPSTCRLSALSKPADTSFSTRERTQVWEDATLAGIAGELAGRYGLALNYKAKTINIKTIEQSQKTDMTFLLDLCESYDLGMKVYDKKLVIFDWGEMEAQEPVLRINRPRIENDNYEYHDTLAGVYTGARIQYKTEDDDEEISLFVGYKDEEGEGCRTLYMNETVDNAAEADQKARAAVNKANREAVTFNCDIWPNVNVTSGVTIEIMNMGAADGKYFVDRMTFSRSGDSGAVQSLEMHKCQQRI